MKKVGTVLVVTAVLIIATGQGLSAVFNDGGTHNINSTIYENVWVDLQTPGMQTTVNLVAGGYIPPHYSLNGFNDSRINISGGKMDGDLSAKDNSQVTISGGILNSYFYANNSSQITMSGGAVMIELSAKDNSQVTISGGTVGYLNASGSSQVTVSGGIILSPLELSNNANVIMKGSNFAINGSPVGFGTILGVNNWPLRRLTGTLANGDIINTLFDIGNDASITLVPEPTTLLLLGLGAVMLRRKH